MNTIDERLLPLAGATGHRACCALPSGTQPVGAWTVTISSRTGFLKLGMNASGHRLVKAFHPARPVKSNTPAHLKILHSNSSEQDRQGTC